MSGEEMRPRAYLDFVRDRVLADIKARPAQGPLLGQPEPTPLADRCEHGHVGYMVDRVPYGQRCTECERIRHAARRSNRRMP